jgi:hypothetical protein
MYSGVGLTGVEVNTLARVNKQESSYIVHGGGSRVPPVNEDVDTR